MLWIIRFDYIWLLKRTKKQKENHAFMVICIYFDVFKELLIYFGASKYCPKVGNR